jgi:hypothetical protein
MMGTEIAHLEVESQRGAQPINQLRPGAKVFSFWAGKVVQKPELSGGHLTMVLT